MKDNVKFSIDYVNFYLISMMIIVRAAQQTAVSLVEDIDQLVNK